jgi:hypothetical protein
MVRTSNREKEDKKTMSSNKGQGIEKKKKRTW